MHRNFILSFMCLFWALFVDTFVAGDSVKVISANRVDVTLANISKENEKHTILIIGDGHIRECASKVTDNLNKNYSVTGMVKPGSLFVQWQSLL
jgi:hypothetical protein